MRSATLDIFEFLASDHQVSGETVAYETPAAPFAVENHTEKAACIHDPWLQMRLLTADTYFILDSGQ